MEGTAARAWREALEAWALPQDILDAAPENPYAIPVAMLTTPFVDPLTTPTGERILEVLGDDGDLLDVGCGAGRFSGAFTEHHRVTGVEPVAHFAEVARERGIDVVAGRWPDVAEQVAPATVVCATHVLYDVQAAAPFLAAMLAAAKRRVVLELTPHHPWVGLGDLYRRFHDLDRPSGPSAEDAAAVITEVAGDAPQLQRWLRPGHVYPDVAALVAHRRRQLCLPAERDPEIAVALEGSYQPLPDGRVELPPYPLTTLWLDG